MLKPASEKRTPRDALPLLAVALLTLAVFWGVTGNDFIDYDDLAYVVENPRVAGGLSLANVVWAFTSGYAANWHPVTWLSHMLDVDLFGMDPQGHHAVNVILHSLNASLLFLTLQRLTGSRWRSLLVSLFFALHPLRVESVAWVAERKDVLSGAFAMLTLFAYAGYARSGKIAQYLLMTSFFALGLMSKPMLVTLPFVMLLLDFWPLRRMEDRQGAPIFPPRLVLEKAPLLAMAAISSFVTFQVQASSGAVHSLSATPLTLRISNSVVAYLRYIGKTFWPGHLSVIYPYPPGIPLWQALLCGAVLIAVTAGAILLRRKMPYLLPGWLWFLGTLVPVIGLVPVGVQSMADRYSYFPQIGILIMVVWAVSDIAAARKRLRVALAGAAAVLLAASSVTTWSYGRCWENSHTLFTQAIAATSDNYYGHYMYGVTLFKAKRFQEALPEFAESVRINPRFAEGFVYMGMVQAKEGALAPAADSFGRALAVNPDYGIAHYQLAEALQTQGRTDEAVTHYYRALRLDPSSMTLNYNLGVAFMRMARYDEAIVRLSEALRLDPGSEETRRSMALCARLREGKGQEGPKNEEKPGPI